jgi:hypothetical protein
VVVIAQVRLFIGRLEMKKASDAFVFRMLIVAAVMTLVFISSSF